MTTKIEYWSDHIDCPKTTFRNLTDESIRKVMIAALEANDIDCDIWAHKQTIDFSQWVEKDFCFIKINGVITEEQIK